MRFANHSTTNKKHKPLVLATVLAVSLLSGCASTISDITGSGPVGVMPGDRTIAQRMRDGGIERNAKVNLYKLDDRFEKRSRVNIAAFHDAVLLTGQVPDPHLVSLASQSVKAIREVKAVHNELKVSSQASYGDIVQDGVTKAAIRKNLLMLPDFNESRAKIVVERGHVYIMGMMTEPERKMVLDTVQKSNNIVKIISLIDIIDANGNSVNKPKAATVPATQKTSALQPAVNLPAAVDSEAISAQPQAEIASPTIQRKVIPATATQPKVVVHPPQTLKPAVPTVVR